MNAFYCTLCTLYLRKIEEQVGVDWQRGSQGKMIKHYGGGPGTPEKVNQ